MFPKLIRVSFAGLALAAAILSAHAQKFSPKSIRFDGDPEYSNDELISASGLKAGTVISYQDMNDTSKRLMDTGMFASLAYKFDGQDLTFQVTAADQLAPIHLDNLPLAPGSDVESRLRHQFPLYHGKVPPEGGLLEQVRASLEEMLAAQGIKASVLATPSPDNKTHHVGSIHFTIATPPVQIEVKQIVGASPEFQAELNDIAKADAKLPFDTDASAAGIEKSITTFYEDRGYAAVGVKADRVGNVAVDPAAIVVPYSVKVEEGRIYKIGNVHLPENTPVTADEMKKILADRPGGPVPGIRLRSLWNLIDQRYRAKGYLDCKVTPTPHFDETAATANYDVAVEAGPVYHLAFVKFDNVSDQLRALLLRNWQMLPGDPFNESYVANFIASAQLNDPVLKRTLAGVKTTFDVMADQQTHDVNVVIRLAR